MTGEPAHHFLQYLNFLVLIEISRNSITGLNIFISRPNMKPRVLGTPLWGPPLENMQMYTACEMSKSHRQEKRCIVDILLLNKAYGITGDTGYESRMHFNFTLKQNFRGRTQEPCS